jgi:hypothetical protein
MWRKYRRLAKYGGEKPKAWRQRKYRWPASMAANIGVMAMAKISINNNGNSYAGVKYRRDQSAHQ